MSSKIIFTITSGPRACDTLVFMEHDTDLAPDSGCIDFLSPQCGASLCSSLLCTGASLVTNNPVGRASSGKTKADQSAHKLLCPSQRKLAGGAPFCRTHACQTPPGQASGFLRSRTRSLAVALSPGAVRAGQRKRPAWHIRPVSRLRRCTLAREVWESP